MEKQEELPQNETVISVDNLFEEKIPSKASFKKDTNEDHKMQES